MTDVEKILLDKGLLALSGVIVSLVTALWVERYKRNEAVTLELGKARANALVFIIGATREIELLLSTLGGATHADRQTPERKNQLARLETVREELAQEGLRRISLMDRVLFDEVLSYMETLAELEDEFDEAVAQQAVVPAQRSQQIFKRGVHLRQKLLRYFPKLRAIEKPVPGR